MTFDLNNAPEQRDGGTIPDGTIAVVHLTLRPGNAGEGGWLKRSKAGDSEALDCEFTVVDGPHAKRKFWALFTLQGATDGHAKAADISASRLRAILESAKGIRPDDQSEAAKAARRVSSWGDFDNLRFIAKIGIEKGKDGYKDKNTLDVAITPERKAWHPVEQVAQQQAQSSFSQIGTTAQTAAAKPAAIKKPVWAS